MKRTRQLRRSLVSLFCFLWPVLIGCGAANDLNGGMIQAQAHPIVAQSCTSAVPAGNPAGYWPMDTNGFQGVYQFTGQAKSKDASNPYIRGANLEWSWARIEPVEGQFDWTKVDADIKVWTSQGKQVILRFSTGGQIAWSGSVKGSYTPSWLFDTYGVPRVTELNGTVFPVYWNATYLRKLANFVNAVAARYDTNPSVAAVQVGIGQGGETEPDGSASHNPHRLQLWQGYGYTNALWWQTIQRIVAINERAWTHTPLALMITSTFLKYNDKVYNRSLVERYTVKEGLLLQINSLDDAMPTSLLANGVNQLTTTIEEQRQSARQSGYPAIHDVKHAIALGARYALIFAEDLANPSNADALTYAEQHIATPLMQDCSGNNRTLAQTGRVMPVPGLSGQPGDYAQLFDGVTGSASISQPALSNSSAWSLGAWLYPTTLPQTAAIAVMNGTDSGGFGFGIAGAQGGRGSQLVAYLPGVGWVDSGYTFSTARQWYHIVVTRDGATVRFYVDGSATSGTSTIAPGMPTAHFSIGSSFDASSGAATHFFSGAIDNVVAYTSALNQVQIKAHA